MRESSQFPELSPVSTADRGEHWRFFLPSEAVVEERILGYIIPGESPPDDRKPASRKERREQ